MWRCSLFFVFSSKPSGNKLEPSILLPGGKNSSLLKNKLSESQGYLAPANDKPPPQQTGVGQQLISANTHGTEYHQLSTLGAC